MWIYKGAEMGLEGIIGVPAEDLSDEDFAKYSAKQNSQFPDQMGSLARSGLYVYAEDSKPAPISTRRSSSQPEQVVESEAPTVKPEADSNSEEAK